VAVRDQEPSQRTDRLSLLRPYPAHPTTSLAGTAPHLLGDWHPTRNGDLSPTDVLPHSRTPVWWQCPEHHEWAAAPGNRLTGTGHGCPDCAAHARLPVHHQPAAASGENQGRHRPVRQVAAP